MLMAELNVIADASLMVVKLVAIRLVTMRLEIMSLKRIIKKYLSPKRRNQAFLYPKLGWILPN